MVLVFIDDSKTCIIMYFEHYTLTNVAKENGFGCDKLGGGRSI